MKWQDSSPVWRPQSFDGLADLIGSDEVSTSGADSEVAELVTPRNLQSRIRALRATAPDHGRVVVLIDARAGETVASHLGQVGHEQGGLLLGQVFGRDIPELVLIEKALPSLVAESTSMSLRMDSEVWNQTRALINERSLVIGWYHSHPDLGAFFSGTDCRTQAAFFHHAYSLGWVIDPIRREQCFYLGAESIEIDADDCFVVRGRGVGDVRRQESNQDGQPDLV